MAYPKSVSSVTKFTFVDIPYTRLSMPLSSRAKESHLWYTRLWWEYSCPSPCPLVSPCGRTCDSCEESTGTCQPPWKPKPTVLIEDPKTSSLRVITNTWWICYSQPNRRRNGTIVSLRKYPWVRRNPWTRPASCWCLLLGEWTIRKLHRVLAEETQS